MDYKVYTVGKKYKYLTFGSFLFFVGALSLSLYLLFFSENEGSTLQQVALTVIALMFGLVSYFYLRTLFSFKHYDICADADGLWSNFKGKQNNLIKWSEIKGFKEFQYLQKIQLLDYQGNKLEDLHYQLNNFHNLIDTLISKVIHNYQSVRPFTLRAPITFHAFWLGGLIVWSYFLYSIFVLDLNLLYAIAPVFCFLVFVYVYAHSILKITFDEKRVNCWTLLKKDSYDYEKIKEIKIIEDSDDGNKLIMLAVIMKNGEGFKLPKLNSNVLDTYFKLAILAKYKVS